MLLHVKSIKTYW